MKPIPAASLEEDEDDDLVFIWYNQQHHQHGQVREREAVVSARRERAQSDHPFNGPAGRSAGSNSDRKNHLNDFRASLDGAA